MSDTIVILLLIFSCLLITCLMFFAWVLFRVSSSGARSGSREFKSLLHLVERLVEHKDAPTLHKSNIDAIHAQERMADTRSEETIEKLCNPVPVPKNRQPTGPPDILNTAGLGAVAQ